VPNLRSKLTYANVMATIAVFIALGGSSYAALRITGKNVTDGTLSGKDIKNQSLTGGDVKNGTLAPTDFKRDALPAGPRGEQGPQGEPGPPGAPASVAGYGGRASNFVLNGSGSTVVSKNLPAGKYLLHANAELESLGNPSTGYMGGISVVECWIPGYQSADYYLDPDGTYISEMESLSLNSAIDHPGGAVELKCDRVWNDARVREAALTAVRVGSLG
jgi:hypothetical protein